MFVSKKNSNNTNIKTDNWTRIPVTSPDFNCSYTGIRTVVKDHSRALYSISLFIQDVEHGPATTEILHQRTKTFSWKMFYSTKDKRMDKTKLYIVKATKQIYKIYQKGNYNLR